MLKLKSLRLNGVGRFVEEQSIDFTRLGNLIQIDGENHNTGGSSGSGKSTIFNALDYLLGLNDLPTTVLQSRITKEPISVTGVFDWDNQELIIVRSKKGLSIEVSGRVIEGSSKLTEEKLDEILGMPRDLFRKILHKRQKESGFFLDFTPKKMYEFLTDALNLVAERKKLEKVETKGKELEIKKNTSFHQINSIQSSLKATQEGILSLGLPPVRDIHQPVILELKGKYDGSEKRFKEVEKRQRSEAIELEEGRPNVRVSAYDTSTRERLERSRREIEESLNGIAIAERDRVARAQAIVAAKNLEKNQVEYQIIEANSAKKTATEIAGQIKKIRDAICPTCEQSWVTETAKVKEDELLTRLAICKEKILIGVQATEREKLISGDLLDAHKQLVPFIDPQIDVLNKEIEKIDTLIMEEKNNANVHVASQNAINSNILQQFARKQYDLRSDHSQELGQIRGQMEIDLRAFESAVSKLKAYEDARIRYENSLAMMKSKEKETENYLLQEQVNLDKIEQELIMAEELKRVVKSFISCSFDDALESIGDSATKLIRNIPNMSTATIQFEGQKETKDGKVKEEVNAVISTDGEIGIPIKSLSGGERTAVDLAVDLAVIDLIESVSGIGINLYILDEAFNGMDSVGIEMALEVLKNSNGDKKLIIVDHNELVKAMVTDRIVVVRDGNTSIIMNMENS